MKQNKADRSTSVLHRMKWNDPEQCWKFTVTEVTICSYHKENADPVNVFSGAEVTSVFTQIMISSTVQCQSQVLSFHPCRNILCSLFWRWTSKDTFLAFGSKLLLICWMWMVIVSFRFEIIYCHSYIIYYTAEDVYVWSMHNIIFQWHTCIIHKLYEWSRPT